MFSYILFNVLIDAIKPNLEKKFENCFIFLRDWLGEVSWQRTKMATKILFKRDEKLICP